MQRAIQGTWVQGSVHSKAYRAFIPSPLPPVPAIDLQEVTQSLERAMLALGELNGVMQTDLDPAIINYMYVRKEAVLSSQIEGTQSTLNDLLQYEADDMRGIPMADVCEVSSYVAALNYGIEQIRTGFPLSLRLIREIHRHLLHNTRGHTRMPGEFRTTQNWIGGIHPGNAHFVPPPPECLMQILGEWESWLHDDIDQLPVLIKAALMHVQFETIHPFLDGNGRTGRLLITLFLYARGLLITPCLYLSLFFKKNRALYYDKLSDVRLHGDWEAWLLFFLQGIQETAYDAKQTCLAIQTLFADHRHKIARLGRARTSALTVFTEFCKKPRLTVAELVKRTKISKPTVIKSLNHLHAIGIITKQPEKKWGQVYTYADYVNLLTPDSDPL